MKRVLKIKGSDWEDAIALEKILKLKQCWGKESSI